MDDKEKNERRKKIIKRIGIGLLIAIGIPLLIFGACIIIIRRSF